jgi:acetyl-CoA carboxylase/biotin carboxylase 1
MTEIKGAASNGVAGSANGPTRTLPYVSGKASYSERHPVADHFIGGNSLEKAPSSKVKDFVKEHDGHTVITNARLTTGPSAS